MEKINYEEAVKQLQDSLRKFNECVTDLKISYLYACIDKPTEKDKKDLGDIFFEMEQIQASIQQAEKQSKRLEQKLKT